MTRTEETGGGKPLPARILVVDDEEVIHISVRRTLGRQGHEVDAVFSAQEGLERLESHDYDMVVTDLMMPEVDGIELLERLKEKGITVPVLMITGYPTINTALKALRLGAVDYLAKPFTRCELLGPVNRALRRASGAALASEPAAGAPEVADGFAEPTVALRPGERLRLREHTWALFLQDGTMEVGIEASFLRAVGPIRALELPSESDFVEQGYIGFRFTTETGEEHGAFVPLSGQVVAVNAEAAASPADIAADVWLIRVVPSRLDAELEALARG